MTFELWQTTDESRLWHKLLAQWLKLSPAKRSGSAPCMPMPLYTATWSPQAPDRRRGRPVPWGRRTRDMHPLFPTSETAYNVVSPGRNKKTTMWTWGDGVVVSPHHTRRVVCLNGKVRGRCQGRGQHHSECREKTAYASACRASTEMGLGIVVVVDHETSTLHSLLPTNRAIPGSSWPCQWRTIEGLEERTGQSMQRGHIRRTSG